MFRIAGEEKFDVTLTGMANRGGFSQIEGSVQGVQGGLIYANTPVGRLGDVYEIRGSRLGKQLAQVVGFSGNRVVLAPVDGVEGIGFGEGISFVGSSKIRLSLPENHLGGVFNTFGNCIYSLDRLPSQGATIELSLEGDPPSVFDRREASRRYITGIRSIDGLLPLAEGQRIGLFAEAGVGKSSLLGMMARASTADVVVVSLVGERGREVYDFVHRLLGPGGMKRTAIIVATSDESAMRRALAPLAATALAEYHRARGRRVLLLVDSLTRMGRAWRDIALASGELPYQRGFPPSVFARLPRLLERAGNDRNGSITAVYTVLTPGGVEQFDPFGEEIKSIIDGHIVLSRKAATRGVYPAISFEESVSRLVDQIAEPPPEAARRMVLRAISRLEQERDLLLLGGSPDDELARIIANEAKVDQFLSQSLSDFSLAKETDQELFELAKLLRTRSPCR